MPRKHTVRDFHMGSYYHIFNEGANNYPLFHDDQDFQTIETFLESYLTLPPDKEQLKITIEFNGKKLTGVPRQPNNFYGELKLVTYCFTPLQFHLVFYQDPAQAIPKFMQSLTTRFSMYFNRRHQRTGSPFRGKYKAIRLDNEADLMHLSRYLHRKGWQENSRSSYTAYLNQVSTPWLTTQPILDFFASDRPELSTQKLLEQFTLDERLDSSTELGEITLDS